MHKRMMNYFAYGSNMLHERLMERTPSAIALGTARLGGHVLRWHKIGQDGSAKCDIVELANGLVWGVLYEIAASEKNDLDRAEGLGRGYAEKKVLVEIEGRPVDALTYFATAIDSTRKPFSWYRDLVHYGAKQNGLPEDYIAQIAAVPVETDENTDRHHRHTALLPGTRT